MTEVMHLLRESPSMILPVKAFVLTGGLQDASRSAYFPRCVGTAFMGDGVLVSVCWNVHAGIMDDAVLDAAGVQDLGPAFSTRLHQILEGILWTEFRRCDQHIRSSK